MSKMSQKLLYWPSTKFMFCKLCFIYFPFPAEEPPQLLQLHSGQRQSREELLSSKRERFEQAPKESWSSPTQNTLHPKQSKNTLNTRHDHKVTVKKIQSVAQVVERSPWRRDSKRWSYQTISSLERSLQSTRSACRYCPQRTGRNLPAAQSVVRVRAMMADLLHCHNYFHCI